MPKTRLLCSSAVLRAPPFRHRRGGLCRALVVLAVLALVTGGGAVQAQLPLYGATAIHDPSTIAKDGGTYFVFGTGQGVVSISSTDLRNWNVAPQVFPGGPPAWTTAAVTNFNGNFWAPDVAFFNGTYHLYYSCSNFATNDSAIGVATSPSLTNPVWTDLGKVVKSDPPGQTAADTDYTNYNCIDPGAFVDTDGSVWLVFGSYFSGIVVRRINPATGKPLNTTTTLIANNAGGGNGSTLEAGAIYRHGTYYYLFVNAGQCCSGVDSTYNIRVGRSASVTGPYLDQDGISMANGGGTVLLESSARRIGPGHAGILEDNGTYWFSYHFYDGLANGAPRLAIQELKWSGDGWPTLTGDWSAQYTFDVDAREHLGLYNGSLANGAPTVAEPQRGSVLNLDGVSQYASLPLSMANASTFSAWVKWNGGPAWQRIFDFGLGATKYLFLTPAGGNAKMRFAIRNGGTEQTLDAPSALPVNTWCHVAVTLDGANAVLYLNGAAVASSTTIDIRPWQLLARNNYIGRSQFAADPYFSGQIDGVRIFGRALSAAEVAAIAETPSPLAHRYSFAGDVRDSIGMAHGGLKGSATIVNSALILSGTPGGYANLPGGIVSGSAAATIEAWATFGANGNWARLFDFGNTDGVTGSDFLFWSPHTSLSTNRLGMLTSGGTLSVDAPGTLDNQTAHIVCIVDPAGGYAATYVNGVFQMQSSGSVPALSGVNSARSFIGRSLFGADAWLNASVDEFRIYDGRMPQQQIAANYYAGADVVGNALTWTAAANQNWNGASANWSNGTTGTPWADDALAVFGATGAGAVNLTGNVQSQSIAFTAGGYSIFSANGSAITLGAASTRIFAASDASIAAPLVGVNGLTKTATGKLSLTAGNTYSGDTTIQGGTLSLLGTGALYAGGYNNTAVLTINGGATLELDRWGYGPAGTYRTQALGGLDYNPSRFIINGGTVRMTGGTGGSPQNPAEAPYGPGFTIGANGATLDAAKAGDVWTVKFDSRGFGPIASSVGGALTLTGIGDGIFDKVLPGTGGLIKTGAGTWTLTRTNTNTGATAVNVGTLNVSGALAAGSAVIVAGGAILTGTGTISGSLSFAANAVHAPGNSIGTQAIVGPLSYATGARLKWTLPSNSDAPGAASRLAAGTITVASGAQLDLVFNGVGSTTNFFDEFWTQPRTWQILSSANLSGAFALGVISADSAGRIASNYGSLSLSQNANGITLAWTPKPYTAWRGANFAANAGNVAASDFLANPDGDALVNIWEYFHALDPNTAGASPLHAQRTADRVTLSFPRNTAASDMFVRIQGADSLASPWADLAQSSAGSAFISLVGGVSVSESGTGPTRTVTFTDAYLTSDPAHPQRFFRLWIQAQ